MEIYQWHRDDPVFGLAAGADPVQIGQEILVALGWIYDSVLE